MALQVWLPLNGDLHNQGLKNIKPVGNGITLDNNGKIGQCYSFNGSNSISINAVVLPSQTPAWSFTCWFYLSDTTMTTASCFFSERTGTNSTGYTIFIYPKTGKILVDDGMRWEITPQTFTQNTWYHLAITRNSSGKKLYINGELKGSTSTIGNTTTVNTNGCLIGLAQSSSALATGNQGIKGKLNDIRIYNHCLSAKEVEEISKGLVLHYLLNNDNNSGYGWLYPNGERTVTRASSNTFIDYEFNPNLISNTDTSYIVNFDAKGSVSGMELDLYFRNSSGTAYAITTKQTLTTNWVHYSLSISGSPETLQIFRARCYKGTAGDIIYLRNVKLLSNNMPFLGTIVYDSSGYNNNGTAYNTFQLINNSVRYSKSLYFNGNNNAILIPFNNILGLTAAGNTPYTFSCWIYVSEVSSKSWATILGGQSGFEIETRTSSSTTNGCFYAYSWGKGNKDFSLNNWHHLAMTNNTTETKWYLNGEYFYTGTSPNIPYGNFYIGSWKNTTSQNFKGQVSDFRIYSTCLTAAQIKELYNTSMKIENGVITPRNLQ